MTHKTTHPAKSKSIPYIFFCVLSGILINLLGYFVTFVLHAPIWLGSVGTVLCSCILGPVSGSITGILTIILMQPDTPLFWLYGLASIPISFGTSILYQRTKLRNAFQLVCTGVLIMMFSTIISVPLNMLLRDGYIGNVWGDALVDMLLLNRNNPWFCCTLGQLFVELPDKILVIFISHLFLKLYLMIHKK